MGYYGYLPFEWGYKAASWVRKSAALHTVMSRCPCILLLSWSKCLRSQGMIMVYTIQFPNLKCGIPWHPRWLVKIISPCLFLLCLVPKNGGQWAETETLETFGFPGLGGNTNRPLANWERQVELVTSENPGCMPQKPGGCDFSTLKLKTQHWSRLRKGWQVPFPPKIRMDQNG